MAGCSSSGPILELPKPGTCKLGGIYKFFTLVSSSWMVEYDGVLAPKAWSCTKLWHSAAKECFHAATTMKESIIGGKYL